MTRHRIEVIAYAVGGIVLGLFYYQLKGAMSGPVFLGVVIAYLIAVRIVGYLIAKRYAKSTSVGEAGSDA
jgi:hypothetical protein